MCLYGHTLLVLKKKAPRLRGFFESSYPIVDEHALLHCFNGIVDRVRIPVSVQIHGLRGLRW